MRATLFALLAAAVAHAAPAPATPPPKKPTCAVLQFAGDLDKKQANLLSDTLRSALAETGRFRVQSKAEMLQVMGDVQKFNKSDACDESCAVEAGKMLQVQFIASGHVDKADDATWVFLQLSNVETGEIEKSLRESCAGCTASGLLDKVETLAAKLAGVASSSRADESDRQRDESPSVSDAPPATTLDGPARGPEPSTPRSFVPFVRGGLSAELGGVGVGGGLYFGSHWSATLGLGGWTFSSGHDYPGLASFSAAIAYNGAGPETGWWAGAVLGYSQATVSGVADVFDPVTGTTTRQSVNVLATGATLGVAGGWQWRSGKHQLRAGLGVGYVSVAAPTASESGPTAFLDLTYAFLFR